MNKNNKASRTDSNVSKRRRYTIDEADIDGYLNTKKEAVYKKMIWELLNKDYSTRKHQPNKNQKAPKPNNNNKRAASQVDMEMEKKEKKKKELGSKINFDVLEKEEEEEEKAPGNLEVDGLEEGNESNVDDGYGQYLYRGDDGCLDMDLKAPGHLEIDERLSGGGDGDYRDGHEDEDDGYGQLLYREDDGCDDNDEEYWIQS